MSQVEAGVLKLVADKDDPTITVVMDCECENTVGFPLERLKSRIRLLQDHYPCRLASLLVVNLPPEMRGLAQEVLQVHLIFDTLLFTSLNVSMALSFFFPFPFLISNNLKKLKYNNAIKLMRSFHVAPDFESCDTEESAFKRLPSLHGTVSCTAWDKRKYSPISWWQMQMPGL